MESLTTFAARLKSFPFKAAVDVMQIGLKSRNSPVRPTRVCLCGEVEWAAWDQGGSQQSPERQEAWARR